MMRAGTMPYSASTKVTETVLPTASAGLPKPIRRVASSLTTRLTPRATIALALAAKAYAFLKGRGYVTPQDVKSIGMDVLRHRVAITYEAEAEEKTSETVIQKIFDELPVP